MTRLIVFWITYLTAVFLVLTLGTLYLERANQAAAAEGQVYIEQQAPITKWSCPEFNLPKRPGQGILVGSACAYI